MLDHSYSMLLLSIVCERQRRRNAKRRDAGGAGEVVALWLQAVFASCSDTWCQSSARVFDGKRTIDTTRTMA